MKKVFDEVAWYALGRKGNTHKQKHGVLKENKNVTKIQNLLSILPKDDYYTNNFKFLAKK